MNKKQSFFVKAAKLGVLVVFVYGLIEVTIWGGLRVLRLTGRLSQPPERVLTLLPKHREWIESWIEPEGVDSEVEQLEARLERFEPALPRFFQADVGTMREGVPEAGQADHARRW